MANLKFVMVLMTGEAGWTADQYGHSRFGPNFSAATDSSKKQLTAFMRSVLKVSC